MRVLGGKLVIRQVRRLLALPWLALAEVFSTGYQAALCFRQHRCELPFSSLLCQ